MSELSEVIGIFITGIIIKDFPVKSDKTCLFIDGSSIYSASRQAGFDIDYNRLLEHFKKNHNLIRANYYAALLDTDEYSPLKPLTDWLSYNGYNLITKDAVEITDQASGKRRVKGNMDVDIAVDMLALAPHIDHAILFSGCGDFVRCVEAVKQQGVIVTVVSLREMTSDALRRAADNSIEFSSLRPFIEKKHAGEQIEKPAVRRTPITMG